MKNETINIKTLLSTLWIFVILNYLYCDIMGLMDFKLLSQYLAGNVGGMEINEGFLLAAAILMEIPIAMVLLSRILENKANRWANIIATDRSKLCLFYPLGCNVTKQHRYRLNN